MELLQFDIKVAKTNIDFSQCLDMELLQFDLKVAKQ
jgi:hypothetical protein